MAERAVGQPFWKMYNSSCCIIMCRVEIHESYQFVSKSYHSMQYHFRSIDTWLNGICRRLELIAEALNVSFYPIIL